MDKNYVFSKDEFDKMYEQAQEIYGNLTIIRKFCREYQNIDEFYAIIPLINYTIGTADKLYLKFIENE